MLMPIEINFNNYRNRMLKESWLSMFGGTLKEILRRMFGRLPTPQEIQTALAEQQDDLGQEAVDQIQQDAQPGLVSPVPPETESVSNNFIKVKGTDEEIKVFVDTLLAEYSYMDMYLKFGLDDPRVLDARHSLNDAIADFEDITEVMWPFN
jgi:hypothetical protein